MDNKILINLKDFFISLSHLLDIGDEYLEYHQIRTAFIAWKIGERLELDKDKLNELIIASLVHDIGAISLENKMSLRNFDFEELDIHAYRGFYILQKVEGFMEIANTVRNHHKSYTELGENEFLAQIINLSDSVERSINRDLLILEQSTGIIEKHKISEKFHPLVKEIFLSISKSENFWIDLVNPRIKEFFYNSSICNYEIPKKMLYDLSFLIKDIIDFKSPFTLRHSMGVMFCAEALAEKLGFGEEETEELTMAALLHDVGKLIIPTSIIMKPDKLDKNEKAKMEEHPYYTYMFLKEAGYSEKICIDASYHHEELGGRGYPFRLQEEKIPIGARIVAASDVFVALNEDRPYRKALDRDEITKIMKEFSGYKLDKNLVDLLLDNFEHIDNKLIKAGLEMKREYRIFNEIDENYGRI